MTPGWLTVNIDNAHSVWAAVRGLTPSSEALPSRALVPVVNSLSVCCLWVKPGSAVVWDEAGTWVYEVLQKISTACCKNVAHLFFDIRMIIHYEGVPNVQTVNQVYYLEVLKSLREKVRWKGPELFTNNVWLLYHNNAPDHVVLSVREFLTSKQITVLENPPDPYGLASKVFFLHLKI